MPVRTTVFALVPDEDGVHETAAVTSVSGRSGRPGNFPAARPNISLKLTPYVRQMRLWFEVRPVAGARSGLAKIGAPSKQNIYRLCERDLRGTAVFPEYVYGRG